MRQLLSLLFIVMLAIACNSDAENRPGDVQLQTAPNGSKTDYAYALKNPDQWEIGPRENTQIVLQAMKNYEQGNIDAAMDAYADTIDLRFDGFEGSILKDSLKAMFRMAFGSMKGMQITMNDFVSLKSKNNKEEWVSLWFKQKWQNQNNHWDSIFVMHDIRLKSGRIAVLDEKIRHFGKRK